MFDRFTPSARKVMALSRKEAQRFRHDCIGTEHILLGLALDGSAIETDGLGSDLKIERIREAVSKHVSRGPTIATMGQLLFTPRARRALQRTVEEADTLGHDHIGTGHLLLGLIRQHDATAVRVLLDLDIDLGRLRAGALRYLEAPESDDQCAAVTIRVRAVETDNRTISVERQALYWCIVIAYLVGVMVVVTHVPDRVLRALATAIVAGFLVQYLTGPYSEEEKETRPFFLARPLWRRWAAIAAAGIGFVVAYVLEVTLAQLMTIITGWAIWYSTVGIVRRLFRSRGRTSGDPEDEDSLNEGAKE